MGAGQPDDQYGGVAGSESAGEKEGEIEYMAKKMDAKKILFTQFWTSQGWRSQKQLYITEEELQYAKEQGYLFDYPERISHKEYLKRLKEISGKITIEEVANAFLFSLSTRKLEYRSALGSYWYAISVPEHEFSGCDEYHSSCAICGWRGWKVQPDEREQRGGYSTYSFERYKWGGVRHCTASYALFDLEQFLKMEKPEHTKEDEQILSEIFHCISELEPRNKVGALQKVISQKKIVKSNKQEVDQLLDILGICGVLSSEEHPCYYDRFASRGDRNPPELTNDHEFPANWWQASDGINMKCLERVFEKECTERWF